MKKLPYVLIIAGLLIGPAYWVYAKFYSGSPALSVPLAALSSPVAVNWRSDEFALNANMAPAGLVLTIQGSPPPDINPMAGYGANRYSVTLFRDGEKGQPLTFTLGKGKAENGKLFFQEHLLLMQKVLPGRYRVEVTALADSTLQVEKMQFSVQQHLHEPDSRIVTTGMMIFVLGILGWVMI